MLLVGFANYTNKNKVFLYVKPLLNKISPGRALLHKPEILEQILPEHSVLQSIDFAEAFHDELLVTEGKNFNMS